MVAAKLILGFAVLAVVAAETVEEKPKRDLLLGTYGYPYPYPLSYGAPLGYAPMAALPAAAPLGYAAPLSYYAPAAPLAAPVAPVATPLLDDSKYTPGKYERMYTGVRPIYNPYIHL